MNFRPNPRIAKSQTSILDLLRPPTELGVLFVLRLAQVFRLALDLLQERLASALTEHGESEIPPVGGYRSFGPREML